jgi:hypothetical protein
VVCGDLIAVRRACSAGDSARIGAAERGTINIRNRIIDIFYSRIEAKHPTLNVERLMFNAEVHDARLSTLIKSIDNFAGSFDSASLRSG